MCLILGKRLLAWSGRDKIGSVMITDNKRKKTKVNSLPFVSFAVCTLHLLKVRTFVFAVIRSVFIYMYCIHSIHWFKYHVGDNKTKWEEMFFLFAVDVFKRHSLSRIRFQVLSFFAPHTAKYSLIHGVFSSVFLLKERLFFQSISLSVNREKEILEAWDGRSRENDRFYSHWGHWGIRSEFGPKQGSALDDGAFFIQKIV